MRPADDFATQFERIADLAPARPAILCGDRRLTWADLDAGADRLAAHLAASGVRAEDRFALAARNSPEYLVALVAVLKLAATPVNVNYRYRAAEVRHVLQSSGAVGVVADADLVDVVVAAGAETVVPIEQGVGFGAAVDAVPRHPRVPRGDTEWLLFTGGTTGHPKAVLGSQSERLRAVGAAGMSALGLDPTDGLRAALDRDPFGPGGVVHLPAPPLMHGTGLYSALGAMAVGAPVALLPGPGTTGTDLLTAVSRHGVTDLTIVGDAFALRFLDALDAAVAAGRPLGIDRLRRVRSIGAVWSPPVKRRLLAHADLTLIDTIAASEGGVYAISSVTRANVDDQAGTFTLAPGARLLDTDDRDVPPGSAEVGLLAAPVVAGAGYEGDPERTADAFRDLDGVRYSIPGDMAQLDADGRLRLLGRGSQVINTGGEKVYADEVELVLRDHPAVRDAVVLGVPDATWGSVVAAVVSLSAGAAAGPDDITAFVGERLASYKKPRLVAVVDEVQRLVTGKTDLRWAAARFPAAHTPTARPSAPTT